ncbi:MULTISPECIES: D-2-hydroxyacid dehydrogenase family protein [unclassified Pantoea]|uniref:D-2-hydroxyacid dehydrogenase family protein n=1 Tax=unclassified Pantoea TaxID=2630326 RepID=UPI001CD4BC9D|nr:MULTISPECIES: D-2-hydroxyacid dehydrogenase family protein [unclassified Pantoea]MCA1179241.1 D-2-hydroxyacid dehydrogenase family protein [Pantoea sp. alder69]MCA1251638.1 D-2-hydroxyacid dehydrogenase family protein [Pantoea sp. alder70]MCA1267730.1 D-2-hydroxyacid dehydrogenase family protein [Pantoea sp. alder81]
MSLHCLILDDYQNVALSLADWTSLQPTVQTTALTQHFDNEDELVRHIEHADILVVMRERTPLTAELIGRLPNLKLVVTSGMRNASIDLHACAERYIAVCGTASSSAAPMELSWGLLIGLARHIGVESQALRNNGPWQQTLGLGLQGKTLGLVGLGKIGGEMAKVAQAFGMRVCAWSQNLTDARAAECGVERMDSLHALMRISDFVSVHLVLSERSRHLIDSDALAQMKPGALLINTSRAAIVDQQAMIAALQSGQLAGVGIDVFEQEPLPADHPLRHLPTVLATPHLGYVADSNYRTYFTQAVEDIQGWVTGAPLRSLL